MPVARCACGALTVTIPCYSETVVVCHCDACKRRTGSAFGVGMYVDAATTTIDGAYAGYDRITASGATFRTSFCPGCGSALFWTTERHPDAIGIAYGSFCDPALPPPIRSVWEEKAQVWATIPAVLHHFPRGRS